MAQIPVPAGEGSQTDYIEQTEFLKAPVNPSPAPIPAKAAKAPTKPGK